MRLRIESHPFQKAPLKKSIVSKISLREAGLRGLGIATVR